MINNFSNQLFICFAAEDRYNIVEPVVYHLKNYGIEVWYDRHILVMGDNRIKKNLIEGASECRYAIAILSQHTASSKCAMEELSIIEKRHYQGKVTVFPILYELSPDNIPHDLHWVKDLIFKEVDRHSGTREICNHISCKITDDFLHKYHYKNVGDILSVSPEFLPPATYSILQSYRKIDYANLNSRVSLLYSAYLTIVHSDSVPTTAIINMMSKIFERLFSETQLNLVIDYRELWLLENAICILVNCYLDSCTESNI